MHEQPMPVASESNQPEPPEEPGSERTMGSGQGELEAVPRPTVPLAPEMSFERQERVGCFLFPEWCFSFPWGHFSRIGFFCARIWFSVPGFGFLVPSGFFCSLASSFPSRHLFTTASNKIGR